MASKFPPVKDGELYTMAANASARISASPGTYGLDSSQAELLAMLSAAYSAAYKTAIEPTTRTRPSIAAKDRARDALAQCLRDLNRFVRATKTVTDAQRLEIGFPVYARGLPIAAPATAPVIKSAQTNGRRTKLTLRGLEGDRRARPRGVQGALIVSHPGPVPPADMTMWKTERLSTRMTCEIEWPATFPTGTQVWLAAAWYSARGKRGPMCAPVATIIGSGLSTPALTADAAAPVLREAA